MREKCVLTLFVDEYDKGIRFFCDKLGLFRVDSNTDIGNGNRFVYLSFIDERFAFAINLTRPSGDDHLLIGRQAGTQLLFSLPIGDPDSMIARLNEQRVETESDTDLPYGRQITLRDCFGNRISLFHRYSF